MASLEFLKLQVWKFLTKCFLCGRIVRERNTWLYVINVPVRYILIRSSHFSDFNPVLANVPIFFPLKTLENQRFPGVFREHKIGLLTRNSLIISSFLQLPIQGHLLIHHQKVLTDVGNVAVSLLLFITLNSFNTLI